MLSSNTSAVSGDTTYIEDVFSTWLYTGNGSTQTINNGIDLAGKGGLVWTKKRDSVMVNCLVDTARGVNTALQTDGTNANTDITGDFGSFLSSGYSLNTPAVYNRLNQNGGSYTSWTFRKQPKFFDVVTYTGNGTAGLTISHNLGSIPGCIIVKRTDTVSNWAVYHNGINGGINPQNYYMFLNKTDAQASTFNIWNNTAPTSTQFTVGSDTYVNASGGTYVAYIFAHNAGGFGLTGTDNVISCGSYTGNAAAEQQINLGYEAQWVLIKRTDSATGGNWQIYDTMRGIPVNGSSASLVPNLSDAEGASASALWPNATGFSVGSNNNTNGSARSYIYIAIRRGSMKVPTDATKVFAPTVYTGNATAGTARTTGILTDMVWSQSRQGNAYPVDYDRLRGKATRLAQNLTNAEVAETGTAIGVSGFDAMNGYIAGEDQGAGGINFSGWTYANWNFRRAPSFFDEVCYTGTGATATINHNLGVAPELLIFKTRSTIENWSTWYGCTSTNTNRVYLNKTDAGVNDTYAVFNQLSGPPTATQIGLKTSGEVNGSGTTYVAYLFATCAGVSKVGSYTGNGSSQTIACGFAGGARFVLIKRTDSTGDWYVWDTARGIVSGNDPHLSLNTTAAEVTTDDTIDPDSSGFIVNQLAATNVNVNAATYIFLAIA